MDRTHPAPVNHNRLIIRLLVMVAAAFAFAFALVPLYNVLCRVTGFNGKVTGEKTIRDGFGVGGLKTDKVPTSNIDLGRIVRVEFTGTVMPGLPWDMRPLTLSLDIHPGELQQVSYLVRNTSNHRRSGCTQYQPGPSRATLREDRVFLFFPANAWPW